MHMSALCLSSRSTRSGIGTGGGGDDGAGASGRIYMHSGISMPGDRFGDLAPTVEAGEISGVHGWCLVMSR